MEPNLSSPKNMIGADGFDPSVIPATGSPVPGGLQWYESLVL